MRGHQQVVDYNAVAVWTAFVAISLAGSALHIAVHWRWSPAVDEYRHKISETGRGMVRRCQSEISGRQPMGIPGRARVLSGLMILSLMAAASPAAAQESGRFELGGHFSTLSLNEFDVTDVGVGGQAAWRLTPTLAVDGALTWFPDGGHISSSLQNQQRVMGVVGLRAGLIQSRVEVFGKARPGFLRFNPQDFVVCIAIFPTPLSCQIAAGYTAFAFDLGGGAHFTLDRAGRTFLRVEAGDLLIRYGLETYRPKGEITDGFLGHNFIVNVGGGWKF